MVTYCKSLDRYFKDLSFDINIAVIGRILCEIFKKKRFQTSMSVQKYKATREKITSIWQHILLYM